MRFMLKIKLQEFYDCKDMVKLVRKHAKRDDIYRRDIALIRVHKELKCVVFLIERKQQAIEVVSSMPQA